MFKTSEELNAFIESPRYQSFALQSSTGRWQDALNMDGGRAVRLHAWETLQAIAVMFETYGDLLDGVEARVVMDNEPSMGDIVSSHMIVNGETLWSIDHISEMDLDLQDRLEEVDGTKALEEGLDHFFNLPRQAVHEYFDLFDKLMGPSMNSAAQARAQAEKALGPLAPQMAPLLFDLAPQVDEQSPSRRFAP